MISNAMSNLRVLRPTYMSGNEQNIGRVWHIFNNVQIGGVAAALKYTHFVEFKKNDFGQFKGKQN